MAYTRYVNTASTAGGDGTTNNTTGATRAYAGIEEAMTGEAGTLTDDLIISCCGTAADTLTGGVEFGAGWTFGVYSVTVQGNEAEADGAHEGQFSTSHYRMTKAVTDSTGAFIGRNNGNNVIWKRFQVQNTVAGGEFSYIFRETNGATSVFDGMIIQMHTNGRCIHLEDSGTTATVKASLIYSLNAGTASEGLYVGLSATSMDVYNCTIENFDDGIERDTGTLTVTNCAIFNSGTQDVDPDTGMNVTYCAIDQTYTGTGNFTPVSWTAELTDYVNGDYSLLDSGETNKLYQGGTDLSGSGVTEDITGATIVNDSIGCFDALAAGGGNLAGTITAGATVSGNLKGRGTLAGSITAGATPTGNLKATGLMSGSIVAGATPTGNLVGISKISGTISAGATVSGNLGAQSIAGLAGSVDAGVSVTGNLIGRSKLSGSVDSGITLSGILGSISTTLISGSINAGIALSGSLLITEIEAPQSGGAPITHRKAETLREYYAKKLTKEQIRGLKLAYGRPEIKKELEETYQEIIEEIEEIPTYETEMIQEKLDSLISFVDSRIAKIKLDEEENEEALIIAIIQAHNRR